MSVCNYCDGTGLQIVISEAPHKKIPCTHCDAIGVRLKASEIRRNYISVLEARISELEGQVKELVEALEEIKAACNEMFGSASAPEFEIYRIANVVLAKHAEKESKLRERAAE